MVLSETLPLYLVGFGCLGKEVETCIMWQESVVALEIPANVLVKVWGTDGGRIKYAVLSS